MIFIELFTTFFIIGMFTIGGGYAMLSLIQNEVVTVHGWMDDGTFTDIEEIEGETANEVYYDLQGRVVMNPTNGIYILNGKKIIINNK